jgi:hypothetical protein
MFGSPAPCGLQKDEVLSELTVLDRKQQMKIEEMLCPGRLTCDIYFEPSVILTHYNIPERAISVSQLLWLPKATANVSEICPLSITQQPLLLKLNEQQSP